METIGEVYGAQKLPAIAKPKNIVQAIRGPKDRTHETD